MMYWIIEIILLVLILATIIATIAAIVKEKKEYKHLELDEQYGVDDEDVHSKRPEARRRRPSGQPGASGAQSTASKKRRWKIILEDTATEERYSYIFYNNIGIGRTTKEAAFEGFLSLPEDRKVSKVHCSIIRSQDSLYLKDEGSRNYTFLNGKKVQKPVAIQKDDIISVGETELEIVKVLRETK